MDPNKSIKVSKLYSAEDCNEHYHHLLQQGRMKLSVPFDLPTRLGHDSDHNLSEGKVGVSGVAIDSMTDMEKLFKGIRLEDVFTSMETGASGFILLAFYVALAKKQGADLKKISGAFQKEMLTEFATKDTYIYPVKHSLRITNDVLEWCSEVVPKWDTRTISSDPAAGIETIKPESTVLETDDSIRQIQIEKLNLLRRQRNPARCDSILQGLNDCAAGDDNIMPAVVEAVENKCTLGEIADTLREVYGEYKNID